MSQEQGLPVFDGPLELPYLSTHDVALRCYQRRRSPAPAAARVGPPITSVP
jgi:hypothetical protein